MGRTRRIHRHEHRQPLLGNEEIPAQGLQAVDMAVSGVFGIAVPGVLPIMGRPGFVTYNSGTVVDLYCGFSVLSSWTHRRSVSM